VVDENWKSHGTTLTLAPRKHKQRIWFNFNPQSTASMLTDPLSLNILGSWKITNTDKHFIKMLTVITCFRDTERPAAAAASLSLSSHRTQKITNTAHYVEKFKVEIQSQLRYKIAHKIRKAFFFNVMHYVATHNTWKEFKRTKDFRVTMFISK